MRVCVIGAGPAGLLAAHGATMGGADEVLILDSKPAYRPWTIFSLQYLHHPCGMDGAIRQLWLSYEVEPKGVEFSKEEARALYNRKLGRELNDENSTRFLWENPVGVWSLKDAYRELWKWYRRYVTEHLVRWEDLAEALPRKHDLVVNTAPLNFLRPDLTWPIRAGLIRMDYSPVERHPRDTCIYNLDPATPWYRATNLDGGLATEYVKGAEIIAQPLRKVVTHSNSLDLPANVLLTGRWGSWHAEKLTHHAYLETREATRRATGSVRTAGEVH